MRRRARVLLAAPMLASMPPAVSQSGPTSAGSSAATRLVPEAYLAACMARDRGKLAPLLADEAGSSDPTAEFVVGKVGIRGKAASLENSGQGCAGVKHMQFREARAFCPGAQTILEGTIDRTWLLDGGPGVVTRAMPFVAILGIEAGQVVAPMDLADDRRFIEAHRKARAVADAMAAGAVTPHSRLER